MTTTAIQAQHAHNVVRLARVDAALSAQADYDASELLPPDWRRPMPRVKLTRGVGAQLPCRWPTVGSARPGADGGEARSGMRRPRYGWTTNSSRSDSVRPVLSQTSYRPGRLYRLSGKNADSQPWPP